MATFATTVLGKRRKRQLVLRLSSSPSPSETSTVVATTSAASSEAASIVSLKTSKKSRYPCTYTECKKSYSKLSRLEEHYRSHTGERPFTCNECGKSYLRETHLQAHTRSHLPELERPYVCTESVDCRKRFWTMQHLAIHENTHRGDKSYICPEADCVEVFAKHHQLRAHICETHSPPGTKPYICSHAGCTKSFTTNQKLRGHVKTHDERRYTCSHLNCLPESDKDPVYFGTWTALQAHIRTVHPPTCTHSSCKGRTFASQQNLRAHQKLHEQQEVEKQLYTADGDDDNNDGECPQPRKRRRGGELGRDWKCDFTGCGKDFKSKKALTTHHNVIHLGQRNHVCPHVHCKSAFGYKHLLERHLAKIHSSVVAEASEEDTGATDTEDDMDIEAITGLTYLIRSRKPTSMRCPYPHLDALVASSVDLEHPRASSSKACEHVLTRAYDLRRHLRSEHGIDTDKAKVDAWVRVQRHAQAS